jgi:hypothetical protein
MATVAFEVPPRFTTLIQQVTSTLVGRPLTPALADQLNRDFPPDGRWFADLAALCITGCREGWLCAREAGGIRFGRVIKAGAETDGFSVDVVEMVDIEGPHHSHPNGEIDLILPLTEAASFDGITSGWKVYPPGTAHRPTVSGGKAMVLYLLPDGAIEFTSG